MWAEFPRGALRDAVAEAGDAERCRGGREHGEPGEGERCCRSVNSAAPGRDREKKGPPGEALPHRRTDINLHRSRVFFGVKARPAAVGY